MFDQIVKVYRSPKEVFDQASMASFEGKSVTDGHPNDDVRPDNYSSYEKGQVTNVRQGTGDEADCVVADLIIKDPNLISEIEAGKREVSCGHYCNYEPLGDGQYQQTQIRGNHVAVVVAGRAGDRIAIKDESPKLKQTERSKKRMKANKNTIIGKMLAAFAKDADPEELAEASKMAVGMEKDETPAAPPIPPESPKVVNETPAVDPALAEVNKKIDDLTAIVAKLVESDKRVHEEVPPKDALDELVAELEATPEKPAEEESVTIPAENMDEAPVAPEGDKPENPIPGADRNAILNAIKAVRPVIASIQDPAERKKASDALAKTFRDQVAAAKPAANDGYGGIMQAMVNNTKKAKDKQTVDHAQLGKDIAKKFNPHYKEAK